MKTFSTEAFPFPMHSVCVWHKGNILQEEYFAPYNKERLHRMFSITKAYTSLAIGALIAEGRLHFDDPIVRWFPEYTPADAHEWLKEMTIHDMLSMRTCHKSTTYKLHSDQHWVRSFFMTPPDHRAGQIFKYDTSSAHTLAALVKKVSGKGVLDYLREVYLDRLGFSADARILEDPFGCEIGGSGMLARPSDLLLTARLLLSLYNNSWEQDYPDLAGCADSIYDRSFWKRYAAYIRDAMSFQTANVHDGKTLDERNGYGYQFWLLRDGGVMMYGMGGQYMAIYPQKELIVITTADTQSTQGGTQYILDEIRRVAMDTPDSLPLAEPKSSSLSLPVNAVLLPNPSGFKNFRLDEKELLIEGAEHSFHFPYSLTEYVETKDPKYGQTIFTKGFPQNDGSLYLHSQILDEYCGAIHFMIRRTQRGSTLYIRKVEESLYQEFNGFFTEA